MVDKSYWIVSRSEYYALVDKRMAEIGARLKKRWIDGEIKKGKCDLFSRNFVVERREELDDQEAYDILEEEKQRRLREVDRGSAT